MSDAFGLILFAVYCARDRRRSPPGSPGSSCGTRRAKKSLDAPRAEERPRARVYSRPCASATASYVTFPSRTLTPRASAASRATASASPCSAIASTYGSVDVRQRLRRRDGHAAGHVRDAVVDDPVDLVHRIGVRRRVRGLDAAALVDRDVDDHRAGLHLGEHLAADELRSARARDEHGADHDVGVAIRCSTSRLEDMSELTRPERISSRWRMRSIERSRIVTCAPRPSAMIAAL